MEADQEQVIREMTKAMQEQAQTVRQLLSIVNEQSRTIGDLSRSVRASAESSLMSSQDEAIRASMLRVQQEMREVMSQLRQWQEGQQSIMGE